MNDSEFIEAEHRYKRAAELRSKINILEQEISAAENELQVISNEGAKRIMTYEVKRNRPGYCNESWLHMVREPELIKFVINHLHCQLNDLTFELKEL